MGESKKRRDQLGDNYWKGRTPMELKFALIADHVSETKEGKLVIVGVFDAIGANSAPAVHPSLFVVARFETSIASGTKHKVRFGLRDEDGAEVLPTTSDLDLNFVSQGPGLPLRGQFIMQVSPLQLPKFGDYEFLIYVNGNQMASVPFRLQNAQVTR